MQRVRAEGPLMAEIGRKNTQKVTLAQFMKLTEEFIHQEDWPGHSSRLRHWKSKPSKKARRPQRLPSRRKRRIPRKGKRSQAHFSPRVSLGSKKF
jgi:hypothetical protein